MGTLICMPPQQSKQKLTCTLTIDNGLLYEHNHFYAQFFSSSLGDCLAKYVQTTELVQEWFPLGFCDQCLYTASEDKPPETFNLLEASLIFIVSFCLYNSHPADQNKWTASALSSHMLELIKSLISSLACTTHIDKSCSHRHI